jgi:hypothetical protein
MFQETHAVLISLGAMLKPTILLERSAEIVYSMPNKSFSDEGL